MKVISKTGKVFSERFAKTAIKIGIGKEVFEAEVTEEDVEETLEEVEKPKRGRKSKK